MQPHTLKPSAWAGWLGVLTLAVLAPLGATRAQDEKAPRTEPNPSEKKEVGDSPSTKEDTSKKVFQNVKYKNAIPPVVPPIVDETGVAFGLRSTALDERRGDVKAVAFSADGKVLATAGGGLKLWDVATAKVLAFVRGSGAVYVAFSLDGKLLATADADGALHLRDPATAQVRTALSREGKGAPVIAFSPDSKLLASAGTGGVVRLWDTASGKEHKTLTGHKFPVSGLAFSADGKTLISSSAINNGGEARVWDLGTGKMRTALATPTSILSLALSPDGKTVATTGGDWAVLLWSTKTGTPVGSLKEEKDVLRSYGRSNPQVVAFAPDGKTVATGHGIGGVILWDAKTRKEIADIGFEPQGSGAYFATPASTAPIAVSQPAYSSPPTVALAFSPDGTRLAVNRGKAAILIDVAKRTQVGRLPPQGTGPQPVLALAYAPDGKTLAIALEDRSVSVRELDTGEERFRLRGHGDKVTCLAFAPNGKTLVSGSADNTVKVWDAASGTERRTFKGHGNWVYAVAFAPDGKTVASGGYDRLIKLWDPATGQESGTLRGHKGAVRSLAFTADGKTLASGGADRRIELWDVEKLREAATLAGHKAAVRALAFSRDGRTLVSASDDGTAKSWDVTNRKEGLTFKDRHFGEVVAVAFAPTGSRVVTAALDSSVWVWDALTGKNPRQLAHMHTGAISAVAFAPDGKTLVTGSYDRTVRLWPGVAVPIRVFRGHQAPVTCAVFSPDGGRVLSAGGTVMSQVDPKQRKLLERADLFGLGHGDRWDHSLHLWDTASAKELRALKGHTDQVLAVAFAPDGRRALSAGHDQTIHLWDLATGKTLKTLAGHKKAVRCVAYAPKGSLAVSGGDDHTVRLWDVATGKQLRLLQEHTLAVQTVAFSPDGRQIVSGGRDGKLCVWNVAGGAPRVLRNGGLVESAVWLRDGRHVVCAGSVMVELWDVKEGKCLRQFAGPSPSHTDRVALLPGDRTAVSVHQDGVARFWDLGEGVEVGRLDLAPVAPSAPNPTGSPYLYPPAAPAAAAEKADEGEDEVKEPQPAQPKTKSGLSGNPIVQVPLVAVPAAGYSVSVSPDGRQLLTVGGGNRNVNAGPGQPTDFTIRLWKTPALERPTRK